MRNRDDRSYFESRARRERALAATCENNRAALAHLLMADAYEQAIAELADRPADRTRSFHERYM